MEATRRGYGTPGTRASSGGGAAPSGVAGDVRASGGPSGLAHLACAGLAVSPEEPDGEQHEPEVDGDDDEDPRGVDIEIVDLPADDGGGGPREARRGREAHRQAEPAPGQHESGDEAR